MTVLRLTPTLYCVTEQLPRRLEREHYVVWSGAAYVYDRSGTRVPAAVEAAIRNWS